MPCQDTQLTVWCPDKTNSQKVLQVVKQNVFDLEVFLHSYGAGTAGRHDESRSVQTDAWQPALKGPQSVPLLTDELHTKLLASDVSSPIMRVDTVGERHLGRGPLEHSDQGNLQTLAVKVYTCSTEHRLWSQLEFEFCLVLSLVRNKIIDQS